MLKNVWLCAVTYWYRARHGWAPRDTWSLDIHLNKVLAGSLMHLANTTHTYPLGYKTHEQWVADLLRWAKAFSEDPEDVDIFDKPIYTLHWAEEHRRRKAIHQALKELEPVWDSLWD